MVPAGHPQPLRSSPPDVFFAAPIPHATTCQARIISPILVIPGCLPITTKLSPSELGQLLPTLHIYIEPSLPGMILLPATSVSYKGLVQALRWREADNEHYTGMQSNLIEIIQIYQALAFLGNRPLSQNLRPLEGIIRAAFEEGLLLEECQHLWALRHFPFTEKWIDLMFRQLVTDYGNVVVDETADFAFYGRLEADEELQAMCMEYYSIFEWIDGDEERRRRLKYTQVKMTMEAKRARRLAKMLRTRRGQPAAAGRFRPGLDSIPE